ncbi:hypothetical protein PoB_004933500 [Plakobranchus ocellatus]|uniref:Uncharacterized protein n=1 Tax=Plakobranchus ocellatus TaxID=259542 RepID=A0AAV4BUL2_9GAST|nr:hypothetical protein PoB_004933500 [Plakobranchus ocellatus]
MFDTLILIWVMKPMEFGHQLTLFVGSEFADPNRFRWYVVHVTGRAANSIEADVYYGSRDDDLEFVVIQAEQQMGSKWISIQAEQK